MEKNGNEIEVLLYLASGQTVCVYMERVDLKGLADILNMAKVGDSLTYTDGAHRYVLRGVVGFKVSS